MTTQELTKEVVALDSKVSAHEEIIKSSCVRLVAVEEAVREQNRILVVIERLTIGIDQLNRKVGELGDKVDVFGGRLNTLELEPAVKWKTLVADLIKLLVAAAVGYGVARIGMQ